MLNFEHITLNYKQEICVDVWVASIHFEWANSGVVKRSGY